MTTTTTEEVMQEMRSHLDARTGPEDWLTPLSLWAEPMGCSWDSACARIGRLPGGPQLLTEYRTARTVREAAYYAALRAASAKRTSLKAVATAFSKSAVSSELIKRLKLKGCRNRLSQDRLRAKAKPGMTLPELAAACGYTCGAIKSWAERGKHKDILTISKRSTPRGGTQRYIERVFSKPTKA